MDTHILFYIKHTCQTKLSLLQLFKVSILAIYSTANMPELDDVQNYISYDGTI